MSSLPPFIAPVRFDDPVSALAQVRTIYEGSIAHLRDACGGDLRERLAGVRFRSVNVVCTNGQLFGC